MSDSQTYDPVTVSSDGVTVAKRFEADEFPVPAIAFRIESSRDETVTIRLVDSVPEDVAVEDLGFHPEYGSEYWTIDDQTITFEREIEAESEYTTVYGIRSTGTDNVEQFLTEPTIEMVDPPLDEEEGDVLDDSSSDVVKDVIAGDSDSVPGLDDGDDDEIETLNLKDPNAPEDEQGGEGGEGEDGATEPSNVTTTLLAEIHHGAVDEDVVRALRKELSINGASGGSSGGGAADARIQHLQNEVSDLSAYTEALEEFLADNGTGDQMIEDFRDRLAAFENELDQIQSMAMENDEQMDSVQSEVGRVTGQVSDVEDTVSSMEGTVDEVEGTVGELDSQVDTIDEEVDTIGADVDGVEDSLSSLEEDVQSLRGDLGEVQDQVGDVSDIDSQIDDIESEIEELKQWREQLSSVIGGGE
jgi:archaellum component FlaC